MEGKTSRTTHCTNRLLSNKWHIEKKGKLLCGLKTLACKPEDKLKLSDAHVHDVQKNVVEPWQNTIRAKNIQNSPSRKRRLFLPWAAKPEGNSAIHLCGWLSTTTSTMSTTPSSHVHSLPSSLNTYKSYCLHKLLRFLLHNKKTITGVTTPQIQLQAIAWTANLYIKCQ